MEPSASSQPPHPGSFEPEAAVPVMNPPGSPAVQEGRVLPLKRSAQERAQAEHTASVSSFTSMLQDRGDITSSSCWSKVKDGFKGDPRCKSVKHDDRENLFNEYVSKLKAAEAETSREAKAQQDEDEKLKERERVLRKGKEREEQEVERVRQRARRNISIESDLALMDEIINDHQGISNDNALNALFKHSVSIRYEEERKEKRAAQKAAVEGFKQLLEEAKEEIDQNTDYQTFKRRWGKDPRFHALDRKDKMRLLNERVLPLKRSAQAERAASASSFMSMLQDRGDITSSSLWSKVKDSFKGDPRCKSVKHEDRENLFNEYVSKLKAAEAKTACEAKAKQYEEVELVVMGLDCGVDEIELKTLSNIREWISVESNPIDELIHHVPVVHRLIDFLGRTDVSKLQCEAASVLASVTSGTSASSSANTAFIVKYGAVPMLVDILHSPDRYVREQGAKALGNIAAVSPLLRNLVLAHGALRPLRAQININTEVSVLKVVTRLVYNLCRGKPPPPFQQVSPALPVLRHLVNVSDEEVLANICWALYYLSDGTDNQIKAVIESDICIPLVNLLCHASPCVLVPALLTIRNIAAGDDSHRQVLIDSKVLPRLQELATQSHKQSIKEACWTIINNITAGNYDQIQVAADL